uniref:Uncharacterized protein n=1 Tax=Arundo donax TaxID=35708 RepID=A0A0A9AXP3_ARUDO
MLCCLSFLSFCCSSVYSANLYLCSVQRWASRREREREREREVWCEI